MKLTRISITRRSCKAPVELLDGHGRRARWRDLEGGAAVKVCRCRFKTGPAVSSKVEGDMIGLTTTWVLECLSAEVDSMTEGVETKGEGMHVGA